VPAVAHELTRVEPCSNACCSAPCRDDAAEMSRRLERRDPDGLHTWLATAASAYGDPGRFFRSSRRDKPSANS
jgi:hypothetical protein